jgi:formylglycine-generating enzyme required for sulfatase activity
MKKTSLILLLFGTISGFAAELKIQQVEWRRDDFSKKLLVQLNLSWKNAWHNAKNHDAAWLFFKFNPHPYSENDNYTHAKIALSGHKLIQNHIPASPAPDFEVPADQIGLFVYPKSTYRGDLNWSILVELDNPGTNIDSRNIGAYGIEMVMVPSGKFTLGDPDTATTKPYFSLYKSGPNGAFKGLFQVEDEKQSINIAPSDGNLYYHSETKLYQGDQTGVLPADFPKGVQAFYLMKYELNQGQYADFLNSISSSATYQRANFGGRDYAQARGSIYFDQEKYQAKSPHRPANFISWDDAMAYADWAGLRPYTELEYEKACRGTAPPLPKEYPWNTSNKEHLIRFVDENDELVFLEGFAESQLKEQNRAQFGASFYWVMDLSGSVWERVITLGDPTGRAFKGSHGDGIIRYGFATNEDWPKGNTETAGFGFRGGGYYRTGQLYGGLNPHATIANRTYAAWSGGMRSKAYGSRFVRSKN